MKKSAAVKQLELDLLEKSIANHPQMAETFPLSYFAKPKREDATANGLTRCIIDFLRLRGCQAERITVTGRANEVKNSSGRTVGIKWTKSHMTVGTADVSATIQGRSVKIEVKIDRDRQSDAQKEYQRQVEAAGGIYYIATDFESFVKWYNELWPNNRI